MIQTAILAARIDLELPSAQRVGILAYFIEEIKVLPMRKILATCALYYANGPIHLGHLIEAIQADIWVRFMRLRGHDCLLISGDDAHGTPIMISAEKQGISPEAMIHAVHKEHLSDFAAFGVAFDQYEHTHSPENRALCTSFYNQLHQNGHIIEQEIEQAFDPIKQMFLPDRFVKGTCPRCGSHDQYGDNCERCGATYAPTDLINPLSTISGATPDQKKSTHLFLALEHFRTPLQQWIEQGHLQAPVANKLKEWFCDTLRDWDISRDAPYFGFEIPTHQDKYFYVWVDAPIGYIASLSQYCKQNPSVSIDDYWHKDSSAEVYHFIGKDIVYFHAIFWPALLLGAGYRLPTNLFVHGYLTINGEKMSKSRGTFITAAHYLQHLNPEFLRYYFSAKLSAHVEDIDLNLEDFMQRNNADLVGKFVNLASRSAGFITKLNQGKLGSHLIEPALFAEFCQADEAIAQAYEERQFNKAVRLIMALADRANQYIDHKKPWVLAKDPATQDTAVAVCTQALNLFKIIATYLKPILPATAEKIETFLHCGPLTWASINQPLLDVTIQPFKPLMQRITTEMLKNISAS